MGCVESKERDYIQNNINQEAAHKDNFDKKITSLLTGTRTAHYLIGTVTPRTFKPGGSSGTVPSTSGGSTKTSNSRPMGSSGTRTSKPRGNSRSRTSSHYGGYSYTAGGG